MKRYLFRILKMQAFRFLVVGGWNTVFAYTVFASLYLFLSETLHYMVILTVVTIITVTNAYFCHKFFVFRTKGNYSQEYLRFYGVYSIQIAINFITLPVLIKLDVSPYLAQAIIIAVTTLGSYMGHKHISFALPNVSEY